MPDEPFLVRAVFNRDLVLAMSADFRNAKDDFDQAQFLSIVGDFDEALSFKARSNKIALSLQHCLPGDFEISYHILKNVLNNFKSSDNWSNFYLLPIGEFIALNGCKAIYLSQSFELLELITKKFTAEFAIRSFIDLFPIETIAFLKKCAVSDNEHLRRLASEGSRPKLPWAKKVVWLNENTDKVFEILALIKFDDSKYVQKSVANHLNDWTKFSPQTVYDFINQMGTDTIARKWVAKHALRNELKKGDARALKMFGFEPPEIELKLFETDRAEITIGECVKLKASIKSNSKFDQKLIIDYKCFFMKANGKSSPKVFKLKQLIIKPGETVHILQKQSFKVLTTRKLYSGLHSFKLLVNGEEFGLATTKLNIL